MDELEQQAQAIDSQAINKDAAAYLFFTLANRYSSQSDLDQAQHWLRRVSQSPVRTRIRIPVPGDNGSIVHRYTYRVILGFPQAESTPETFVDSEPERSDAELSSDPGADHFFPGLDIQSFTHSNWRENRILNYLACNCDEDEILIDDQRGQGSSRPLLDEINVYVPFFNEEPVIQTFDYAGNINVFVDFLNIELNPVLHSEHADVSVFMSPDFGRDLPEAEYTSEYCRVERDDDWQQVDVIIEGGLSEEYGDAQIAQCFARAFLGYIGVHSFSSSEYEAVQVDAFNQRTDLGLVTYHGRLVGISMTDRLLCPLALYRYADRATVTLNSYTRTMNSLARAMTKSRTEMMCLQPNLLVASDF